MRTEEKESAAVDIIENQNQDELENLLEEGNEDSSDASNVSKAFSSPTVPNGKTLPLLIVAWYGSSVLCTNTSKSLHLPWTLLTFVQMILSSVCGIIGIKLFKLAPSLQLVPKPEARILTVLLTLSFCAGFVTLNYSLAKMHVSAVMTMRAAEPVATWLLGLALLPNEKTSINAVVCLIPIVVGAGLSAMAKSGSGAEDAVTTTGLAMVMICNVCFALRSIITKRLKAQVPDIDNFNLFLQLCLMGTIVQGLVLVLVGVPDDKKKSPNEMLNTTVLVNGMTFYLYLQLSWVVLSKIGAVTHSVCNALRRPVICAAGWVVFGGATVEGISGVIIATFGTMLYARAKRQKSREIDGV